MRALGVDAAGKKGWVGVVVDDHGFASAHLARTLVEVIEAADGSGAGAVDAIGVDIPIGLVDAPTRAADVACRQAVGSRRSSVFPAPHPSVIDLPDLAAVNQHLRSLGHPAMSAQGFMLFPRIREAAALADDPRIVEVFPEASFAAMASGHLSSSKKTWNGLIARRVLLAVTQPAIVLPDHLPGVGEVPADDVVDAAAVAWSALRLAHGTAMALGDPAEVDARTGRRVAVWV